MGSGSSSHVQPFDRSKKDGLHSDSQTQEGVSGDQVNDRKREKTTQDPVQIFKNEHEDEDQANLQDAKSKETESDDTTCTSRENQSLRKKVQDLQTKVNELESQNVDLSEQIQILEEQLVKEHTENISKDNGVCSNTVAAKDKYIQKLEKETQQVQEEITKMRAKYKKKVKMMNSQITEAKHESSLHLFEMKDEIQRLKDENTELLGKIKHTSLSDTKSKEESGDDIHEDANSGTGRMELILDLSNRVSEQENKIFDLELKIKERDKTIEKLQTKMRSSSASSGKQTGSGKSRASDSYSRAENDWTAADLNSVLDNEGAKQTNDNYSNIVSSPAKTSHRTKLKKKKSLRERMNKTHTENVEDNPMDTRESSGTSRDSGYDAVNTQMDDQISVDKWLETCTRESRATENSFKDEGIELESVKGTTPGISSGNRGRSISPGSDASKWSDEETNHEVPDNFDLKSNISISSIRRISAPKKKKRHALNGQDPLVVNILKEMEGESDRKPSLQFGEYKFMQNSVTVSGN